MNWRSLTVRAFFWKMALRIMKREHAVYALAISIVLILAGCDRGDDEPLNSGWRSPSELDTRALHSAARPARWRSEALVISGTSYVARVGPVTYTDETDARPDRYKIDVEREDGARSYVLFEKNFAIDSLSPGFLSRPVEDVVQIRNSGTTVEFNIDGKIYEFTLP